MKAVTVWMLIAHGIESQIRGLTQAGGAVWLRSFWRTVQPITRLSRR